MNIRHVFSLCSLSFTIQFLIPEHPAQDFTYIGDGYLIPEFSICLGRFFAFFMGYASRSSYLQMLRVIVK